MVTTIIPLRTHYFHCQMLRLLTDKDGDGEYDDMKHCFVCRTLPHFNKHSSPCCAAQCDNESSRTRRKLCGRVWFACVGMSSGTERRPPHVPLEAAFRVLHSAFNFEDVLESSYKELPCFDDRHFYFKGRLTSSAQRRDQDDGIGGTHEPFVLRITNLMFSAGLVEGFNALMLHLSSRGITCTLPIPSRFGRYMEMVPGEEISLGGRYSQKYPVRVLRYLRGNLMDDLDPKFLTPKFLYSVGNFAGKVNAALEVSVSEFLTS